MRRLLMLAVLLTTCSERGAPGDDFEITGQARFVDELGGAPREGESIRAFAVLQGTGRYIDPACPVRGESGPFRARFDGQATIGEDGRWALRAPRQKVKFTTDQGCVLGGVEVDRIDQATVRGAISPDARACDAYASAKARRAAKDRERVREVCMREGTTAIVAQERFSLDPGAAPDVRLPVDLRFERLERLDGSVVPEDP